MGLGVGGLCAVVVGAYLCWCANKFKDSNAYGAEEAAWKMAAIGVVVIAGGGIAFIIAIVS